MVIQSSILAHPMDRGGWRATIHGTARVDTRLSDKNKKTKNQDGRDKVMVIKGRPEFELRQPKPSLLPQCQAILGSP